ncbi:CASP-like protein 1E2 [Aristolochia californica]|uniref:CASP-like protein 1E2 n=1 Tax=Aristolochia californica TaxID=171875 RepID=UPI0035D945EE
MMEAQMKANVEGTPSTPGRESAVKVANPRSVRSSDFLLRLLAVLTTLTAAIVMGIDKETQMIPFSFSPNMPPLEFPVPAKWHYVSALKFFVVVNAIACAYSGLSLLLSMVPKAGKGSLELGILLLDLIILVLLSTAAGAASAVAVLAANGNSHVNWHKICHIYTKFCRQAGAAIAVSILTMFVFIVVILLSVWNLRRRSG